MNPIETTKTLGTQGFLSSYYEVVMTTIPLDFVVTTD